MFKKRAGFWGFAYVGLNYPKGKSMICEVLGYAYVGLNHA
jgi:hypothetical protein